MQVTVWTKSLHSTTPSSITGAQIPALETGSHAGDVMMSVLTPTRRWATVRNVPLGSVKAGTVGMSDTAPVVALVGAHVGQECNGFFHSKVNIFTGFFNPLQCCQSGQNIERLEVFESEKITAAWLRSCPNGRLEWGCNKFYNVSTHCFNVLNGAWPDLGPPKGNWREMSFVRGEDSAVTVLPEQPWPDGARKLTRVYFAAQEGVWLRDAPRAVL